MVKHKIQNSVLFAIVIGITTTVCLIGSDNPSNKLGNKVGKENNQPSRLLKLAEGLPASTMILLQKFDSISNIIDHKIDVVTISNSK